MDLVGDKKGAGLPDLEAPRSVKSSIETVPIMISTDCNDGSGGVKTQYYQPIGQRKLSAATATTQEELVEQLNLVHFEDGKFAPPPRQQRRRASIEDPACSSKGLSIPKKGFSKSSSEQFQSHPRSCLDHGSDKRITLYKTEMCRTYEETGTCKYGPKCQFAHDRAELREISRHPRYKTEICKTFWEQGNCPYGKRCCFIHTENEIRGDATGKAEELASFKKKAEVMAGPQPERSPEKVESRLLNRLHHHQQSTASSSLPMGASLFHNIGQFRLDRSDPFLDFCGTGPIGSPPSHHAPTMIDPLFENSSDGGFPSEDSWEDEETGMLSADLVAN